MRKLKDNLTEGLHFVPLENSVVGIHNETVLDTLKVYRVKIIKGDNTRNQEPVLGFDAELTKKFKIFNETWKDVDIVFTKSLHKFRLAYKNEVKKCVY